MTDKYWEQLEKILNRFPEIHIKISSLGADEIFGVQLFVGDEGTNICAQASNEMGLDYAMEEFTEYLVEEIKELYKGIK